MRARLDAAVAQPGAPARASVRAPRSLEGERVRVVLVIETPRERLKLPMGEAPVEEGVARIDLSLHYPYERRVTGVYRYTIEALVAGEMVRSRGAVSYGVGATRTWV